MVVKIKLTGTLPLLMNSDRSVDKLDPLTKKLAALTGLSSADKKADEIIHQTREAEFLCAIYHDAEIGPYIPGRNLFAVIRRGAMFNKRGEQVKRGVQIIGAKFPLSYKGPRGLKELVEQIDHFSWTTSLKQGKSRIMRTRPQFDKWSVEFNCLVDEEMIQDLGEIRRFANMAGKYVGLGDSRPQFGLFEAEVTEVSLSLEQLAGVGAC